LATKIQGSAAPNPIAVAPATEIGDRVVLRFLTRFPSHWHREAQHWNRRKVTNKPSKRSTVRLLMRLSMD